MTLKTERISWLQGSRVQAFNHPESELPDDHSRSVQNPSVQASRIQAASRPDSKRPESMPQNNASRIQFFQYVFLFV